MVAAFFPVHSYWPCIDELWAFCLVVSDPVSKVWFRFLVPLNCLRFTHRRKRIRKVKKTGNLLVLFPSSVGRKVKVALEQAVFLLLVALSGAWNFKVVSRLLETLCTPVLYGFAMTVSLPVLKIAQNNKQDRQCTYNETLRRVRESFPCKSSNYYLLVCVYVRARMWVRACSLAFPACNVYAPYCDVICGPSVSTTFFQLVS